MFRSLTYCPPSTNYSSSVYCRPTRLVCLETSSTESVKDWVDLVRLTCQPHEVDKLRFQSTSRLATWPNK